jgi:DNA invertase Pin-like site-specific DNA recombinase
MKYIIYARKSTESDDRQALSINSQISELQEIAKRENLTIVDILEESKSAKKPGRPIFNKMVEKIEKGGIDGILCWKMDRLARNPIDEGTIKWLLQEGVIKKIRTFEKDYLSDDNAVITGIEFGMASQYIRDLSKNVKRGNRAKLSQGGLPGMAYFGYLNDKTNKTIIIDKNRAKYVVRLFALYSQSNKSFKEISNILFEEGLRTQGGNKVGKSVLHRIISNPFYYGVILRDGEYYKGNHKPIISKQTFDTAQNILHGKNDSRKNKHFYPYRGFMTCAECGCVLTGDKKKGRYVYYYCTNGKGNCNQHRKYMANTKADKLMADALSTIQFPTELIEIAYKASLEKFAKNATSHEQIKHDIEKRLKSAREKQSKLIDMYLDNSMPKTDYEAKSKELQTELLDLDNQKDNISKRISNEHSTFELTKEVFLTANKAQNDFLNAEDDKKVYVLENVLSNLTVLNQEMATVTFKMPYEILKKSPTMDDSFILSGTKDLM